MISKLVAVTQLFETMWASAARNFIRDDTISSFAYMFDLPERAEGPGSDRNGMTLL
jgi:hypothetical protein